MKAKLSDLVPKQILQPRVNSYCGKCKHFWVRDEQQKDCPYCEIDRLTKELAEAKAALAKYEGAVEVTGMVDDGPFLTPIGSLELDEYLPSDMIGQPVTVWVKRRAEG